jgi:hypothetical protein
MTKFIFRPMNVFRYQDISLGQTEDPGSNVENFVPEELNNLHLSSCNISFVKSEEYKMS